MANPVAGKVKHGPAKFEIAAILDRFAVSMSLTLGNHGANSVIAVRKNPARFRNLSASMSVNEYRTVERHSDSQGEETR
jgi:hypothetical protein